MTAQDPHHNPAFTGVLARRISGAALFCLLVSLVTCCAGQKAKTPAQDAAKPIARAIAEGPFQPSWDSLQQYECPEWFRDAKFGIWAHWSAQCVPEQGDWYARNMYIQGSNQYKYHVEHYGHPSKFGFKDICNLWHAEKWDPDKLIQLYKRAGAKYFVALANHHCNFDCWNSTYQPWNSVNIGPKKDIVGIWAEAARKQGLRFGVTVHCGRSWSWYEVAHGSDKEGPLAGVPYDGVMTKADGKGQWWEGYDPQDLYCRNHTPGEKPDQAYIDEFFNRVKELIDKYHPDLLYFDDGRVPINEGVGLSIFAHLYNASMHWHGGKNEAVLNTKGMPKNLRKTLVLDIERGLSNELEPYPWQTDTCIGSWHYARSIFEKHHYKTANTVITMLVDIVSKNGNLLLNIPVRGDGTIDDDEVKVLEDIAKWMDVNGECIFGTRPWKIYGEGMARMKGGSFNEGKARPYTGKDIRFTTKGDTLYAILLAWPGEQAVIRALGKASPLVQGEPSDIRLLGCSEKLQWSRDTDGLTVKMPPQKPCDYAFAFKITGLKTVETADTKHLPWVEEFQGIAPGPDGSLKLEADFADLHGSKINVESKGGERNIGFWNDPKEWASWVKVKFLKAGTYDASARVATVKEGTEFVVEVAGQQIIGKVPLTGGYDKFQTIPLGKVVIKQPGEATVKVLPRDAKNWKAINLAWITFTIGK